MEDLPSIPQPPVAKRFKGVQEITSSSSSDTIVEANGKAKQVTKRHDKVPNKLKRRRREKVSMREFLLRAPDKSFFASTCLNPACHIGGLTKSWKSAARAKAVYRTTLKSGSADTLSKNSDIILCAEPFRGIDSEPTFALRIGCVYCVKLGDNINPEIACCTEQVVVLFRDRNSATVSGGESAARAAPVRDGLVLWIAKPMSTGCLYETGFLFTQLAPDRGGGSYHRLCILFPRTLSLLCNVNPQSLHKTNLDKRVFESEFDGDAAHVVSFCNGV